MQAMMADVSSSPGAPDGVSAPAPTSTYLCGVLNREGKPCRRTAACPFHSHLAKRRRSLIQQITPVPAESFAPAAMEVPAFISPFQTSAPRTISLPFMAKQEHKSNQLPLPRQQRKRPGNHAKSSASKKQREKRREWTRLEHIIFLKGLEAYGKGADAWKKIARDLGTRDMRQVQSHAQKYFIYAKQISKNPESLFHLHLSDITEQDEKEVQAALAEAREGNNASPPPSSASKRSKKPISSKSKDSDAHGTESTTDDDERKQREEEAAQEEEEAAEQDELEQDEEDEGLDRYDADSQEQASDDRDEENENYEWPEQPRTIADRAKRRSRRKVVYEEIDDDLLWLYDRVEMQSSDQDKEEFERDERRRHRPHRHGHHGHHKSKRRRHRHKSHKHRHASKKRRLDSDEILSSHYMSKYQEQTHERTPEEQMADMEDAALSLVFFSMGQRR